MKCPKCNMEMMLLTKRDQTGFLNKLYYKCLNCGYTIDIEKTPKTTKQNTNPKPKKQTANLRWKAIAATTIMALALLPILQVPVQVKVFATELPLDSMKDILPYIHLVNFTMSNFTLNYSDTERTLNITANYINLKTTETIQNTTTCNIQLNKVFLNYKDQTRTLNIGLTTLTLNIKIQYQELIAKINATTYMPLWTALINNLLGKTG